MSTTDDVKHLLIKTVQNHHQYQETQLKGEYNTAWSDWYANFLLENGLVELWGRDISQDDLAALLNQLDVDYNSEQREENWPIYYAAKMVAMES